jgi:multisubunit Na+/H+ antiporter MnhE subunit
MARRVKFWLAWYVPLFGLWLVFVDTLAVAELVVGAIAAALAASAADLVREQDLVRFRMRIRWLRGAWSLPRLVVVDSWLLAVALLRELRRPGSVQGLFRVLPFPVDEDDATAAARSAIVASLASVAGNTYVVGVERSEGCVLIHQLVRRSGDEIPTSMLEE